MQYEATIPGAGDKAVSDTAQILALVVLTFSYTTDGYVKKKKLWVCNMQEIIRAMKKNRHKQRDRVMVGCFFKEIGHGRSL